VEEEVEADGTKKEEICEKAPNLPLMPTHG
jgi:hypothetical protein